MVAPVNRLVYPRVAVEVLPLRSTRTHPIIFLNAIKQLEEAFTSESPTPTCLLELQRTLLTVLLGKLPIGAPSAVLHPLSKVATR